MNIQYYNIMRTRAIEETIFTIKKGVNYPKEGTDEKKTRF